MARLSPEAASLPLHGRAAALTIAGIPVWISRSGYTGEDGFEISVPADDAEAFARKSCWPNPKSPPPGSVRATACAWRPGCASTATTSTS